ncbi:MAG: putative addiction module antidote protein [Chitinispirillaceae bacterium]|nr:putative addiction module antidote protein [Chitinispirillaceae bacterium]
MKAKVSNFDVSEYLNDEESIAEYLSSIVEEDDVTLLLSAIGDVAKARGMSRIASKSGLGRESLYKALNSNAKPRFDTVVKVLGALGMKMTFCARTSQRVRRRKARKSFTNHCA